MTDTALARKYIMEDAFAAGVPMLERRWYYSLEVEPGVFTNGLDLSNIALTRAALRNIEVTGLECIDIGSMECLVPVLLMRRGAQRVVAYDRLDLRERVTWLQGKLGVRFDYRCGFPLSRLAEHLGEHASFDLVVFSGVLYHMFEPLAGLLAARRLLRNGGLMIVETAAVVNEEVANYFNANGRYLDGDNYWLPSVACLDYWMRFARLLPLDCWYSVGSIPGCRIAVVARAIDRPAAEPGDEWITLAHHYAFRDYIDWNEVDARGRPPLPYPDTASNAHPLVRSHARVNLMDTVKRQRPYHVTSVADEIRLSLRARY
jgi:SAM-dependent methyltransferase